MAFKKYISILLVTGIIRTCFAQCDRIFLLLEGYFEDDIPEFIQFKARSRDDFNWDHKTTGNNITNIQTLSKDCIIDLTCIGSSVKNCQKKNPYRNTGRFGEDRRYNQDVNRGIKKTNEANKENATTDLNGVKSKPNTTDIITPSNETFGNWFSTTEPSESADITISPDTDISTTVKSEDNITTDTKIITVTTQETVTETQSDEVSSTSPTNTVTSIPYDKDEDPKDGDDNKVLVPIIGTAAGVAGTALGVILAKKYIMGCIHSGVYHIP